MLAKIWALVLSHLTSVGSWAALVLSLVSVSLASGLLGTGELYKVLGWLAAALTTLGVKTLSGGTTTAVPATKTA